MDVYRRAAGVREKCVHGCPGTWYASDVENAVSSGLINGKSDTQFAPEEYLTAAEAVKLAACLHQYAAEGRVTLTPGTLWYRTYVDYAWKNRVLQGPLTWDQPADRRTFMKLFAHALSADALPAVNTVVDNAIPDLSSASDGAEEVYALYRAGILRGSDAQSSCKPDEPIRRSEAAALYAGYRAGGERFRKGIPEGRLGIHRF